MIAGLDRDHVARQVAIGLAHARAGHWDLAVLTLGSALERSPNEPEIYRALGQVWLERPRDDRAFLSKARAALERVASSPAATSEMLTLYGRALLQDGDVDARRARAAAGDAPLPDRSAGPGRSTRRPPRSRTTWSRRARR